MRDPNYHQRLIGHIEAIFSELEHPLVAGSTVLDFGCGDGALVRLLGSSGYSAYGADIVLDGSVASADGQLRIIDPENGRLPFPDNFFDHVFSDNVLEHVSDLSQTFREIRRILKPGGSMLHLFPSKYRPLEAHLKIPFAGVFQSAYYLFFWAMLGLHTRHNRSFSRLERARQNHRYLKEKTFYLSGREMLRICKRYFANAQYVEDAYVKTSPGRPHLLYTLAQYMNFLTTVFAVLRTRVLFARKEAGIGSGNLSSDTGNRS